MVFRLRLTSSKREGMACRALGQIWRLGGCYKGMSGTAVRQVYLGCVLPIMEYGLETWYRKKMVAHITKCQSIQNQALRRVLGAVKTTPIDVLHVEAGVLPIEERFRLTAERKALRIEYGISPTNPIRNDRKCTGKSSPPDCIKNS